MSQKIAIVGSGCAAMGALWALRDSGHEIHIYESESRLGGHTNTATFSKNGQSTPVDTGFITLNKKTYPKLLAFLEDMGVQLSPTDMSISMSLESGASEWAWTSLRGLLAQPSNVLKPSFWRMIFDVIRFNHYATDILATSSEMEDTRSSSGSETLGQYLDRNRYSKEFKEKYLVPIVAATWCTGPDIFAAECPVEWLIRFMWNHHLLESFSNPLPWYTIRGGARTYIDALLRRMPRTKLHMDCRVRSLERAATSDGKVRLSSPASPMPEEYDHVILTCNARRSLSILGSSASPSETSILSSFETTTNTVVLHSDLSLMPTRPYAWASWNYLSPPPSPSPSSPRPVSVTFDMNTLQHIPRGTFGNVLCTMNPPHEPEEATVQGRWTYEHPLYTFEALRAQKELGRIQGKAGVSFAGGWTGFGFHEDAFGSGAEAAVQIGGKAPEGVEWGKVFERGTGPELRVRDWVMRGLIAVVMVGLEIGESIGGYSSGARWWYWEVVAAFWFAVSFLVQQVVKT